jgi:uncharacterized protein YrzB (UPF0473 family)
MDDENDGTLVTLVDEDGNEHEFEHLGTLDYEDATYVALSPVYSDPQQMLDSDGELVIMRIATDDDTGEEVLETVSDEDELAEVTEQFEDMLGDEYDIIDADDGSDEDDGDDDDGADGENGDSSH